jgi:hypothetical protein
MPSSLAARSPIHPRTSATPRADVKKAFHPVRGRDFSVKVDFTRTPFTIGASVAEMALCGFVDPVITSRLLWPSASPRHLEFTAVNERNGNVAAIVAQRVQDHMREYKRV